MPRYFDVSGDMPGGAWMNDRQLGEQLATALAPGTQTGPAQVIAVVSDLLGADLSLLAPLKDLVSRPGFQALSSQPSANGGTRAQREALLNVLGETYQPQVVARLGAFLDGYLASPPGQACIVPPGGAASRGQTSLGSGTPAGAAPAAVTAIAETVILGDDDEDAANAAADPAAGPAAGAVDTPARTSWKGRKLALLLGGVVAALALTAGAALRSNLLCASLGLCSAASIEAAATALEEAQKAANALDEAKDLRSYEAKLNDLDRQLDLIASDAGLSSSQRNKRKQLQQRAEKERDRLKREKAHQQTLKQVNSERESIGKLAPQAAEERRAALLGRLASIPADSFSHTEAETLRLELTPAPPPAPSVPEPSQVPEGAMQAPPLQPPPQQEAPGWQTPAPAPTPRWSPPPPRYSPPPPSPRDEGDSNAPYRDEPLW